MEWLEVSSTAPPLGCAPLPGIRLVAGPVRERVQGWVHRGCCVGLRLGAVEGEEVGVLVPVCITCWSCSVRARLVGCRDSLRTGCVPPAVCGGLSGWCWRTPSHGRGGSALDSQHVWGATSHHVAWCHRRGVWDRSEVGCHLSHCARLPVVVVVSAVIRFLGSLRALVPSRHPLSSVSSHRVSTDSRLILRAEPARGGGCLLFASTGG